MPTNNTNRTTKGVKDFTREELRQILERNAQVGSRKTAKEFNTTWQAVLAIQKKFKSQDAIPLISGVPQLSSTQANEFGLTKQIPERVAIEEPEANAPVVKDNIITSTQLDSSKTYSSLEIENAILREKIVALTEQVEKLRSAVAQIA